jgi:CheY-like chemotaxis protein
MNVSPQLMNYVSHMAKLTADLQDSPSTDAANPTPPPDKPPCVLVVEPDPASRQALADQLKQLELQPLAVPDSLTALNAITCELPDLILLCCDGPGAAGYDRALRSAVVTHALQARIPIFVLATTVDDNLWRHCLQHDIDCVLQKPLGDSDLHTLRLWLSLPMPCDDEPRETCPPEQSVHQWFQGLLAKDIQGFEQALAEHNDEQLIYFAHRLTGAMQILRAHPAARLASRLEQLARGELPRKPNAIDTTLASLKKAITRHFNKHSA